MQDPGINFRQIMNKMLLLLLSLLVVSCAPEDDNNHLLAQDAQVLDEAAATNLDTATSVDSVPGRGADGAFFRGRADAPVVMIDYSDFL